MSVEKLERGTTVLVHGLTNAKELNGYVGVLGAYSVETGRWPVTLPGRREAGINAKAANLHPLPGPRYAVVCNNPSQDMLSQETDHSTFFRGITSIVGDCMTAPLREIFLGLDRLGTIVLPKLTRYDLVAHDVVSPGIEASERPARKALVEWVAGGGTLVITANDYDGDLPGRYVAAGLLWEAFGIPWRSGLSCRTTVKAKTTGALAASAAKRLGEYSTSGLLVCCEDQDGLVVPVDGAVGTAPSEVEAPYFDGPNGRYLRSQLVDRQTGKLKAGVAMAACRPWEKGLVVFVSDTEFCKSTGTLVGLLAARAGCDRYIPYETSLDMKKQREQENGIKDYHSDHYSCESCRMLGQDDRTGSCPCEGSLGLIPGSGSSERVFECDYCGMLFRPSERGTCPSHQAGMDAWCDNVGNLATREYKGHGSSFGRSVYHLKCCGTYCITSADEVDTDDIETICPKALHMNRGLGDHYCEAMRGIMGEKAKGEDFAALDLPEIRDSLSHSEVPMYCRESAEDCSDRIQELLAESEEFATDSDDEYY